MISTAGFRLRIFSLLLVVLLLIGTTGFTLFEGLSPADALYFTVVTVATVGYGDIHPVTREGKILAMFVIILGVGAFLAFFANTTDLLSNRREKQSRREKINMVVEVFYGEVGTEVLTCFSSADPGLDAIRKDLGVGTGWADADFLRTVKRLKAYEYQIEIHRIDLAYLRRLLLDNTALFVRILENPFLSEHETFAELLRAVLHLKEELIHRDDFSKLPASDMAHLTADVRRAYRLLTLQWLDYMKYLKKAYPYLFSLAVRLNPFAADRSPVVAGD